MFLFYNENVDLFFNKFVFWKMKWCFKIMGFVNFVWFFFKYMDYLVFK